MCLLLLSHRQDPDLPFVVAANRDEYRARPTERARFWPERPGLLAGRDLEGGGTWLGLTRTGRFAALTNYRDPARWRPGARSRGELARDFLAGTDPAPDFLEGLLRRAGQYNDFNLIVGRAGRDLYYLSSVEETIREIEPGVYGLGNGLLDASWPKLSRAKDGFRKVLEKARAGAPGVVPSAALFELLSDRRLSPDAELPRTGVPLEWERLLSAIFIDTPTYGTRSSTLAAMDRRGEVVFAERSFFASGGQPPATVEYRFALAPE